VITDSTRLGHVRRVESTTEADLENGDVDRLVTEMAESGGGQRFEVGHRLVGFRLGGRNHPLQATGKIPAVDGPTVDSQALFDSLEVGRGEQSAAIPGGSQHRRQQRRCRALAVGSRNQHDRQSDLGRAEDREHPAHPLEPELDAEMLQPAEQLLDAGHR